MSLLGCVRTMNFTMYVVLRVLTSAVKSCLNASSNVHLARRSSEHLNVNCNNSRLLPQANPKSCFFQETPVARVVVVPFCVAVSCGGIRVPANLKWGRLCHKTIRASQNRGTCHRIVLTLCETCQTLKEIHSLDLLSPWEKQTFEITCGNRLQKILCLPHKQTSN